MAKTLRKLDKCPNCENLLSGDNSFCPECGQENTTKSVSFRILLKDFLDDYFTLDSRFLTSMKPFLMKPGFLTKEFNAGRRVKFMPPLRMYIVFSLVYFIIPRVDNAKQQHESITPIAHHMTDSVHVETVLDTITSTLRTHSQEIGIVTDSLGTRNVNINISNLDKERIEDPIYRDSLVGAMVDKMNIERGTGLRRLMEKIGQNVLGLVSDGGNKFLDDLFDNIPKMMFFLLPISALLIKLFYFRMKPLYVESIIFSLHFHSFAFLMFAVNAALELGGFMSEVVESIIMLSIAIYLLQSLRAVFHQKFGVTFLKTFGIFCTYSFIVMIALSTTFILTLYLYQ